MEYYKAAAFVFHRSLYVPTLNRYVRQVYLQYEHKFNAWSHFGGKREPYEQDSFETAFRELHEEKNCTDTFLRFLKQYKTSFEKKYFMKSKMTVYYVNIDQYFIHGYDFSEDMLEANWFAVEALPSNIRGHIIPQIKHIDDSLTTKLQALSI